MGLNDTPRGDRLHIGIFGRRNAGKSSLINALTGQNLAIVSDTPGTTADPVYKAMELHGVGPVVFIDTAGFDDSGELGQLRVAKTRDVIQRTDLAIVVFDGLELAKGCDRALAKGCDRALAKGQDEALANEREWVDAFREAGVPAITVINKWDALEESERDAARRLAEQRTSCPLAETQAASAIPIPVSAKTGAGVEELRDAIRSAVPEEFMQRRILGDLVTDGSLVLLVMPQDIQAPKGRLILPQVQTIRELLDQRCTVVCTVAGSLANALAALNRAPDLIVTDSQCFGDVYAQKPPESRLTSFSILMAAAKGDIHVFTEGVAAIDAALRDADVASEGDTDVSDNRTAAPFRVLIAEACTHVPQNEDIGTVKIPRLLRQSLGEGVQITSVRGADFPDAEGLKRFDLIIHCGACMFNRRLVMSRVAAAKKVGVPITNYGVFLAKMAGILDKVTLPNQR